MSAKDYSICLSLFNAYIAKTSKRTPGLMLSDRREITEQEILRLIDWWANKKKQENGEDTQTILIGGQPIIEVKLLK